MCWCWLKQFCSVISFSLCILCIFRYHLLTYVKIVKRFWEFYSSLVYCIFLVLLWSLTKALHSIVCTFLFPLVKTMNKSCFTNAVIYTVLVLHSIMLKIVFISLYFSNDMVVLFWQHSHFSASLTFAWEVLQKLSKLSLQIIQQCDKNSSRKWL